MILNIWPQIYGVFLYLKSLTLPSRLMLAMEEMIYSLKPDDILFQCTMRLFLMISIMDSLHSAGALPGNWREGKSLLNTTSCQELCLGARNISTPLASSGSCGGLGADSVQITDSCLES